MTISADHTARGGTGQDQHAPEQAVYTYLPGGAAEAVRKFGITAEDYMLPARHQIQMVDKDGKLKHHSEQGAEPGHEYPLPGTMNSSPPTNSSLSAGGSTTRTPHWSARAAWPFTLPAMARRPVR